MKKLILIIFTLFIFISSSFAFTDQNDYLWANGAVNKWNQKGYISGYPDGTFRGNASITRAEVLSVVNKINNSSIEVNKRSGKDVNLNDWFFETMGKAKAIGLVDVDQNGNLRPNDFATREEVMVILSKLLNVSYTGNLDNAKVKSFLDSNQISPENYRQVAGIIEDGYVNGYKDNTIRPKASITRAEFITIINNAIDEIYTYGDYSRKIINGNVVINGKNVSLKDSNINGKLFVLDGAKVGAPNLINTKVLKGVNSRVGNIIIDENAPGITLSEYEEEHPKVQNEAVIATLKYSETDWTNDDVSIKVSFNDKSIETIGDAKIKAKENGEYIISYIENGKVKNIVAKVSNIDDIDPIVTATVENKGPYAEIKVEVSDDGLSPIVLIKCSNGVINTVDSETGEINKIFTINAEGEYTISVEDEAGNIGTAKVVVSDLREPDVTYKIEHYLQDEFGNYSSTPTKVVDKVGEGKTKVLLIDIEKLAEPGYSYVYGTLDNNTVTEVALAQDMVVKLYYAKQFTLSYDGVGGSNVPDNSIKTYGEEIKVSDMIPTKAGYKFMGWTNLENDFTVKYNPGDSFVENQDVTLYAIWKGIDVNYKVEHYLQQYDGSYLSIPSSVSDLVGENYSVKLIDDVEKIQENNYVFGYAEFNNEEVTEVSLAEGVIIKLFYKYQYTVTFYTGTSTAPNPQKKFFGEEITLTRAVPQIPNYKCIGWSLQNTGTDVDYYPGDKFNLNEDVVLYLVKTLENIQYSIKTFLQQEDGSYTTTPQDSKGAAYKALTEIKIEELGEVKRPTAGYAFDYAELDGSKIESFVLNDNDNYKNLMLYFKREYIISYDTNGGDEAPESQKKYIGTSINITDTIPTKSDCDFVGWSTDKVDLTTMYNPGDIFDKNEDIILYAIWKDTEYTYKVEHYYQDGMDGSYLTITGIIDTYDAKVNTVIKLENIKKEIPGQICGYAELLGNKIEEFGLKESVTVRIYYKKEYIISYDTNGGNEVFDNQKKYFGEDITLIDSIPTKDNCDFLGWNIDKNATTALYQPQDTFSQNEDLDLYAIWYDRSQNAPVP